MLIDNKIIDEEERHIPYNEIDYEIVNLVKDINRVKGIQTIGSCCGHGISPCWIQAVAEDFETLQKFIHDYFYNDTFWKIEIYISDDMINKNDWGCCYFRLTYNNDSILNNCQRNLIITEISERFRMMQALDKDWLLLEVE